MFPKSPLKMTAAAVAATVALVLGTSSSASPVLDEALQGRVVELGLDLALFEGLDEARMAEIAALFDADHDDEALRAAIAAILEGDTTDSPAG